MENQPVLSQRKLSSVGSLFSKSFAMYRKHALVFLQLLSINVVVFICAGAIALLAVLISRDWHMILILLPFVLLFVLIALVIAFWTRASLLYVLSESDTYISATQALKKSWTSLTSFSWVYILTGLCVLGGFFLLIIPGIIFGVWFSFSIYVFIFEGLKGTSALKRSKQLVKGYWWAVFGRFLVLGLLTIIISWIPLLGSIINFFFTVPLGIIYAYLIYEDLKRIQVTA